MSGGEFGKDTKERFRRETVSGVVSCGIQAKEGGEVAEIDNICLNKRARWSISGGGVQSAANWAMR